MYYKQSKVINLAFVIHVHSAKGRGEKKKNIEGERDREKRNGNVHAEIRAYLI